jgi:hypothetical protein
MPSRTNQGLTLAQARVRLEQYGENAIRKDRVSALRRLLAFFWGLPGAGGTCRERVR